MKQQNSQGVAAKRGGNARAMRCIWQAVGVMLLGMFGLGMPHASAGEISLTEYQVKALCVVNFAKYTEWPATTFADTNAPISIGIVGGDPFGDSLRAAVAGKTIGGRPIVLRSIGTDSDCSTCQIVFVGASEVKRLSEIVGSLKGKPVLTVGEAEPFLDQGGIINFALRKGKVRFDVNLKAAEQAGLHISSKVLTLADDVRK